MGNEESLKLRMEQIKKLAETCYQEYSCLQYDSKDEFVRNTISMFFNSKLSIEEITEQLLIIIEDKNFTSREYTTFMYDDDGEYRREVRK